MVLQVTKDVYPKESEFFMHGLCHLPALESHKKYNLKLIEIYEYDEDFEGEVLTHVANILPNDVIVDVFGTYKDKPTFLEFIKEEFDEFDELEISDLIVKVNKKPTKTLMEIANSLDLQDISGEGTEELINCFNYHIKYVGSLVNSLTTKGAKSAINVIEERLDKFYTGYDQDLNKVLHNRDGLLINFFKNSKLGLSLIHI